MIVLGGGEVELICCAIGIAQTQAVQLEDALEMGGDSGNITRQVSSAFMDRAGMFGVHLCGCSQLWQSR